MQFGPVFESVVGEVKQIVSRVDYLLSRKNGTIDDIGHHLTNDGFHISQKDKLVLEEAAPSLKRNEICLLASIVAIGPVNVHIMYLIVKEIFEKEVVLDDLINSSKLYAEDLTKFVSRMDSLYG